MAKRIKPDLGDGISRFTDANGNRQCAGAKMGMSSLLPPDEASPIKLRLIRLPWVDGDYIPNGAYYGRSYYRLIRTAGGAVALDANGDPCRVLDNHGTVSDYIYVAWAAPEDGPLVRIFVRAFDREDAKRKVWKTLPAATFFR